jgi:hypothetical protein
MRRRVTKKRMDYQSPYRKFRRTQIVIDNKTVLMSDDDLDLTFIEELFRSMFCNIDSVKAGLSAGHSTKKLIITTKEVCDGR